MKNLFPVVILAGGLATRLRPLTEKIPKSLIEINGIPFILHQLQLLQQQNIQQVILCLGFLGEQIVKLLNDKKQFNMQINYSFDGNTLLGTAGAIKKALSLITTDHFFVMYGDAYLPCNFLNVQNAFIQNQKSSLMTIQHNHNRWDKSNVEYHQNKILLYDKIHYRPSMEHIDYGLGVFTKKVFSKIPENSNYDLAILYQTLLAEDQLAAFEIKNRFYEIGSFAGIKELEHFLNFPSST